MVNGVTNEDENRASRARRRELVRELLDRYKEDRDYPPIVLDETMKVTNLVPYRTYVLAVVISMICGIVTGIFIGGVIWG